MLDDRYEFKRSLGQGGMAGVFLARDKNLDRLVAIKRIHADLSHQEAVVARFQREARLIARVRHPHIVDIFDVVADDQNTVAMVMEFVDGVDLASVTRRKPPSPMAPELAISIVRPIASALAHAHDSGVVHRDIKPGNILLGIDGAVKLSDFGIARGDEDAALTRPGDFLGTPAYVPPEQARGKPVGPAADQYALGVMLYQLITGIKPFAAPSTGEVLVRIIRGEFTDPRTVCNAVDEPLATLFSRMMALHPEDRFSDMEETLEAFDTISRPISSKALKARVASLCDDPAAAVAHWGRLLADDYVSRAKKAYQSGDRETAARNGLAALARCPDHAGARAVLEVSGGESDGLVAVELDAHGNEDANGETIVSPMTFEELMASEGWQKGHAGGDAGAQAPKPVESDESVDLETLEEVETVEFEEAEVRPSSPPRPPPPPHPKPAPMPTATPTPHRTPAPLRPTAPKAPTPTPGARPAEQVQPSPPARVKPSHDEVTHSSLRRRRRNWSTALLFLLVAVVFGGGTWVILELTRNRAPKSALGPPKRLVIGDAAGPAQLIRVRVVDAQGKGVSMVALSLGGAPVGQTDDDGVFQISRKMKEGEQVQFGLTVPKGYAPLSTKAASTLRFKAPKATVDGAAHELTVKLDRPPGNP